MIRLWLATLLILASASNLRADRDILYEARYYTPAASRTPSHFQIYRINPDGSGKTQLTRGSQDCRYPQWSPDGAHILYESYHGGGGSEQKWVMDANGRNKRLLNVQGWNVPQTVWLADGKTLAVMFFRDGKVGGASQFDMKAYDFRRGKYKSIRGASNLNRLASKGDRILKALLSPNRRLFALEIFNESRPSNSRRELSLVDATTGNARKFPHTSIIEWSVDGNYLLCTDGVIDVRTFKKLKLTDSDEKSGFSWLKGNRIAHFHQIGGDVEHSQWTISVVDVRGKELSKRAVQRPLEDAVYSPDYYQTSLHTSEQHPDRVVETIDGSSSFYRIDALTGKSRMLIDSGNGFAWSPQGDRFVSSPKPELGLLGKHRDGRLLSVWMSGLALYDENGHKLRTLTPGKVIAIVGGWRRRTN